MSAVLTASDAVRRAAAPRGAVSLSGVRRTFAGAAGPVPVLRGVDLDIEPGEIIAVVGPSGCGKSTLLRLLAGLDAPSAGSVTVDGTPLRDTDARTAVAFQEPRLLPWRTLTQNVEIGMPRGTARPDVSARVAELLELVGLTGAASLRPREVSGGMAQRASLARALARGPEVLLLDEPFGALDALTRLRMQDLLLDIHSAEPTTVVLVTHDVEEALYLADRVLQLRAIDADSEDSSIARVIEVPGIRPRDRADRGFTDLRAELLDGLGVDTHRSTPQETR
ncbi:MULTISPECIES: ABC transporter ATP-binding protein [Microbacterium]|uniref:ABC transporter ATP-binding protein n=1 Tax=Microbacterium aquilitoris TaxID=3067307 RepID=A0ABU3GN19_9MICO|nr:MULTISPECIES: ABC transporter ATP-binding protein [unclassified Microbacterium]MDT3331291.1 ABC transporter ATP-binding protein [Microbacterium sp. KSW-18]SDH07982.1 sulfonate transport system ATP-binding protein [Microbacterium sp. 77mftsu3.1]